MGSPRFSELAEDAGDDEMAGAHPSGADEHDGFAAELVNIEDCGDSGQEHGDTDDPGGEKGGGVARCAQGSEDGRGVVENCINTCVFLVRCEVSFC